MTFRERIRPLFLLPLLATVIVTGCVAPMGPGFGLRSREIRVGEIGAAPPQLHIHLTDRMLNAGFRTLDHLDVQLPAGPTFGVAHVSIRVDDRPAQFHSLYKQPGLLRISFQPPWQQRKSRTITFDYDFEPQADARSNVAVTERDFFLIAPNALPQWLAPPALFAVADMSDRKEQVEITAPADFRVLAAGRLKRRRRLGGTTLYQYRVPVGEGPVFLIAGNYIQRSVKTASRRVIFWTFDPLRDRVAQTVARRLANTFADYRKVFGPAGGRSIPLRIVETSATLVPPAGGSPDFSGASFPHGVVLDGRAFPAISSAPVLRLAEYELARTWLGWRARISPDSQLLLGRGLGLFAVVLAAEARGGQAARRADIARLLGEYGKARAKAVSRPLIGPPAAYTVEERAVGAYKAALFCAALEDMAGREKFEDAMRILLHDMRGRQMSYEELRAALEFATGRDFAAIFRSWLAHPGIPSEFRARYAPPA